MKILLVASGSSYATGVASALIEEGHAVIAIDDRQDYALPEWLRSSRILWRTGRRIPWWRHRANEALQQTILRYARSESPDLLLATKGMNINPSTLETLGAAGVRTAVWFPDNGANEPYASWIRDAASQWDHFFSFDSAILRQVPSAMLHRTHVLPFGIDPSAWDVHATAVDERSDFSSDICFIGAPYPDRIRLLERVRDMDLKIWGWSGWQDTSLRQWYRGPLDTAGSARAYRLAKICVNTNVRPLADGVNLKTFEIAAAGGFQLTDHPRDLEASFSIGEELDVFADADDFRSRVEYWLSHEQERVHVAASAKKRVLQEHTLRQRVRVLLNITHPA